MNPDATGILQNANTLYMQGNYKQALALANEVLKTDSKDHEALIARANALHAMDDVEKSIPAYEKILQHYPDNHTVMMLLFQYYGEHNEGEKLRALALHAITFPQQVNLFTQAFIELHGVCEWDILEKATPRMLEIMKTRHEDPIIFQQLLFSLLTMPAFSEDDIFATHKIASSRFINSARGKQFSTHQPAGKKLKIGYVSGDLCMHPVGLFVQFCIELHNRDYFEVYCYADLVYDDDLTKKFRRISDHFIDITKQPAEQVAKKIHDDGIDILIDLGGYTGRVLLEIFAYKPAPVQISYCGYPYSTALPTIDYRICDPYVEGNIKNYTEELIYMPESFLCMGGGYRTSVCSDAPCEKNGYITFGSFNDLRKLNIPTFQLWSRVLLAVPTSKLLIRNRKVSGIFAQKITEQFERLGIEEDRLIFVHGNLDYEEHARNYSDVDIVLDVFPFCGTTTSLETLWHNVPIVTLVGEAHRQRPTYSMLKNIGYEEGIAFTEDEYVEKAVAFAKRTPQALTLIRHCLYTLTRGSLLFQPEAFTSQLDQLYVQAWNKKMGDTRKITDEDKKYTYAFSINPTAAKAAADTINKIDDNSDKSIDLKISDGVSITVPNNIDLLTPYVISEQLDWFEHEVTFIRSVAQSGMHVLDIGASYGAYALSTAKEIGPKGHIWAFDPSIQSNKYLQDSIEKNHFTNVSIIPVALSNRTGFEKIHLDANSEYNSLQLQANDLNELETVSLETLDSCMDQHKWPHIDLVKIDTFGEDLNLVRGGYRFFNAYSPLVMFPYKSSDIVNTTIMDIFENIGYGIYILIPGLQVLTPFNRQETSDGYVLNLFCCKPDTAGKLQGRGLLTAEIHTANNNLLDSYWDTYLKDFPYSAEHIDNWKNNINKHPLPESSAYEHTLNLYASAHSTLTSPERRIACLYAAFSQLLNVLNTHATLPRLLSLIRIASELGKREIAVQVLHDVIVNLHETSTFYPDEPFLAVSSIAEAADPGESLAAWCLAYATAEKEILTHFSSFFSGKDSFELLHAFSELGYPHEGMQRRLQLIRKRFYASSGEQAAT